MHPNQDAQVSRSEFQNSVLPQETNLPSAEQNDFLTPKLNDVPDVPQNAPPVQQNDFFAYQQEPNILPVLQFPDQIINGQLKPDVPIQQFNVGPSEQQPDQFNVPSVPNVPPLQMSQHQQQFNASPTQPVSVQSANTQQQPIVVRQQQQQFNATPAQQVPVQSANAQQQPVLSQQQQPNAPPTQQVPVQSANAQQHPDFVRQQQQLEQPPPVETQNVPPIQSKSFPHLHNEPPSKSYEHHDSLPPKPRQLKLEPPAFIHHDSELDFYARLPSPQKSNSDIASTVVTPRPFLSLTVNVTPAVKDCYFYEAITDFEVDVQVLSGMDIGLHVLDPSGVAVVLRDPVAEASVSVKVSPQHQGKPYAICLDNRKASYGRKKVYLGIDLRINWENPSPAERQAIDQWKSLTNRGNSAEIRMMFDNFDRLADSLNHIGGLLLRTQRLQQRSRNNAAIDRAMMQANKDRVTSWSTFHMVLLILVGIIQTRLIRSLFDEQSSLYRLWVLGRIRSSAPVSSLRY